MLASVAIATREGASMSRRFLLLALLFVFAGCCTPQAVTDVISKTLTALGKG